LAEDREGQRVGVTAAGGEAGLVAGATASSQRNAVGLGVPGEGAGRCAGLGREVAQGAELDEILVAEPFRVDGMELLAAWDGDVDAVADEFVADDFAGDTVLGGDAADAAAVVDQDAQALRGEMGGFGVTHDGPYAGAAGSNLRRVPSDYVAKMAEGDPEPLRDGALSEVLAEQTAGVRSVDAVRVAAGKSGDVDHARRG
jgi:hypothetical protein